MRLLAHAIAQRLTLTSCGVFEEMTEGSTKIGGAGADPCRPGHGTAVHLHADLAEHLAAHHRMLPVLDLDPVACRDAGRLNPDKSEAAG